MRMNKTLVKMLFEYKDKQYNIEDIIPDYLEEEVAIYLYDDGNYSDDSTRADLIRKQYRKNEIPNLPLGSEEIELVNIEIEYL